MRVQLHEIEYHVEVMGQGEPLLLLHGFTGCGANWREVATLLGDGFRVVMPDLLGHGESESPADVARFTIQSQAADLIALLDTLEIERAIVWGYSMGGRLALYTALHYPSRVKALVLESASPGLATESERTARRESDGMLAARLLREGVPAFVDYWESLALWESQQNLPPEKREALRAQRLRNSADGLARSLLGMGTGEQPSLWDRLAEISLPTLLIAGGKDAKFVHIATQMQARLTNAPLVLSQDAGHAVHFEKPEWVVKTVGEWLRINV